MQTIDKKWGSYTDLYFNNKSVTKVKELIIFPGQSISMQKHFNRSEYWFVVEGKATVYSKNEQTNLAKGGVFNQHEIFHFDKQQWHLVANEQKDPLKVVEIQYGAECNEEDIVRDLNIKL